MNDIRIYKSLPEAVKNIFGETRTVARKRYAAGGGINEACVLTLDDGTQLFMKSNTIASLANFKAEADGLNEIRETGAIGVPQVLGAGTDTGFSFLLLTYIGGGNRVRRYWETFAEELAAMHSSPKSGNRERAYFWYSPLIPSAIGRLSGMSVEVLPSGM